MNKFSKTVLAVATVTASGWSMAAPVVCGDSVALTGNAGYVGCAGSFSGNANGDKELSQLATSFPGTNFTYQGKSDDAGSGPFTSSPTSTSGVLTFDVLQKGLFVIGIKGGPDYSFYEYNGGTSGIKALNFDTLGIVTGSGKAGPGLSHASLYTSISAVPEAETYMMMLAGLGVMTFLSRRKKQQARA